MELTKEITATAKKTFTWLKPLLVVAFIVLILWLIYRFIYLPLVYKLSENKINEDIQAQTSDSNIQSIIKEGVNSILNSPEMTQQAYTYAKASNLDLNQVLVTEAIANAKNYGYIN